MFHSDAVSIFWRVLLCLALTFIPCFAVSASVIRRGMVNAIWLSLMMLAQIGVTGYLAFWLWFAVPALGWSFSLLLPIASLIFLVATFRRIDPPGRKLFFSLLIPVALTGLSTLVVLSAGFLYGGFDHPLQTASIRFSHPLPIDNHIPYDFAKGTSKARL